MVKNIPIELDDLEYKKAVKLKNKRTWKEVFKDGLKVKNETKEQSNSL
jgi:hypothetical protein